MTVHSIDELEREKDKLLTFYYFVLNYFNLWPPTCPSNFLFWVIDIKLTSWKKSVEGQAYGLFINN